MLKVGDKVRIKKGVNMYSITTPGSEGVIRRISNMRECVVAFYKLTGDTVAENGTWEIHLAHLELLTSKKKSIKVYGIVKFLKSLERRNK